MKIVLALPGSAQRRSSSISQAGAEHLGLGYLAAYARGQGHDVTVLNYQMDAYLSRWENVAGEDLLDIDACVDQILAEDPHILGLSVTGITISEAIGMSRAVKARRPSVHICWGGHQAYQSARSILEREASVDTVVVGDGEITLARLAAAIADDAPVGSVPGLWHRENGLPRLSGPPVEPMLDDLPPPHRDTLRQLAERGASITDARISTSRGCPFHCTFCVDPSLGYRQKWRARSGEKVVEEIATLVEDFGIRFFWFSEDNFIPPTRAGRARAFEIARLIGERKLDIGYRALLRADAIDGQHDLMTALVGSGLRCVYMGIESGSPRRLEYFKKNETPELYLRVVRQLQKYNIGLQVGFIMFDPLGNWDDFDNDVRFLYDIEELYLFSNFSQVLDVFPGTEISQMLIRRGLLSADFTYDSPFDEYDYEIPDIGRFGRYLQSSYDQELVDLDKFFQRLRVVDLPTLRRRDGTDPVAGLPAFEDALATAIRTLNQTWLAFLETASASARTGGGETDWAWRLERHKAAARSCYDRFITAAALFPRPLANAVTALPVRFRTEPVLCPGQ